MTNEEKQEIISAVLESLRVNSRRIEDLTTVQTLVGSEYLEIDGGRKIAVIALKSIIQAAIESNSVDPLGIRVNALENSVDNLQRDKFNIADIVEAEGNNSTYVMSQKFVTQKLGEIRTKLGKISVSLGTGDGSNVYLVFTDQSGAQSTITLAKATTTKAGVLSAADKSIINRLDKSEITDMSVLCDDENVIIDLGVNNGQGHSGIIPTAGTIPEGEENAVAGVMSAEQAADLADVILQVYPLVAAISYSNAGTFEKGLSVVPNVTVDVLRRGVGVATEATVTSTLRVVETPGNTPSDKFYLAYDAITENASFNIAITHKGMTVNLPQQQYRFANYVYGEVIDEEPANIAATIFNATTLKELGTRTTYNGTLAADKMFLFAVPGNVNLVCRHSETGASISGCVTGQTNVPRQNNANFTDLYSYIIVPASDIAWNFKIVNS